MLRKDFIESYLRKEMDYHLPTMNIYSENLNNILKSKYSNEVIKELALYGFKIDDVSADEFDISQLEKDESKHKSFDERDYLIEDDYENIKKHKISCVDLAKYTDGWHDTLPFVDLYKIYNKEDIQKNISEIINNVCFGYKKYDMYANKDLLLGNYLQFLDLYIPEDVDWDLLYKSFIDFLELSLIKKQID